MSGNYTRGITVTRERVEDIAIDWPEKPENLTNQMIDQYEVPDEVTGQRLFWHDVGVWERVQVYRDGILHNFPEQHEDRFRQTINCPIDPEVADDLIAFDGSNKHYRTRDELAANYHKENTNILTLNPAHDIVTGEKSVGEARQAFAENAIEAEMGEDPPCATRLQFDAPQGDHGDLDESISTDGTKTRSKRRSKISAKGENDASSKVPWKETRKTNSRSIVSNFCPSGSRESK